MMFAEIVRAELLAAFRAGGGAFNAAAWFLLCVVFFAVALGPAPQDVARAGPAIIFAAALFAAAASYERIIETDRESGALAIIETAGASLALYALAKAAGHSITVMGPLLVAAPVAVLLTGMPAGDGLRLILALALAAPAFSLYGALAGALAAGLPRASVLMAVLTAPLLAPTLIFGVGAAKDGGPAFLLLGAASLFALAVAPAAAATALKGAGR
jgi:heme exporter protein B